MNPPRNTKQLILIAISVAFSVLNAHASTAPLKNSLILRHPSARKSSRKFVGAVYTMTNDFSDNSVIAYGRFHDGTLALIDFFSTGGRGAFLDAGEGVDPLISAGSVAFSFRRGRPNFVLAVNAGSNSVTVFKVLRDFSLRRTSITRLPRASGAGPVSISVRHNLVFVATADATGTLEAPPTSQRGALSGFILTRNGKLLRIKGGVRKLDGRPGAVDISADGRSVVVSLVFAGSAALGASKVEQIVSFRILRSGRLSQYPVDTATSTKLGNAEGRNLPTSIGLKIVKGGRSQFVIVTEARGISPTGMPTSAQTGSVSVWKLTSYGRFIPVSLDVLTGESFTSGQSATCWVAVSPNLRYLWVSNTGADTVSAFRLSSRGEPSLALEVAARGEAPIDVAISSDGKFLYQMFSGSVGAFEIENGGNGAGLTNIQMPMNVPEKNAQGIVAF